MDIFGGGVIFKATTGDSTLVINISLHVELLV